MPKLELLLLLFCKFLLSLHYQLNRGSFFRPQVYASFIEAILFCGSRIGLLSLISLQCLLYYWKLLDVNVVKTRFYFILYLLISLVFLLLQLNL